MRSLLRLLVAAAIVAAFAGVVTGPRAHASQEIDSVAPLLMADEGGHATEPGSATSDVDAALFWSIVGIVAGVIVMAGLYLVKRAVGGFPRNPSWVAPISVERSSTFLDDTKLGDFPGGSSAAHH